MYTHEEGHDDFRKIRPGAAAGAITYFEKKYHLPTAWRFFVPLCLNKQQQRLSVHTYERVGVIYLTTHFEL